MKIEIIAIDTVEDTTRIEYKNRVIQIYSHGEQVCFFVMKEDGNDDKEFFCLIEAIRHINKETKKAEKNKKPR